MKQEDSSRGEVFRHPSKDGPHLILVPYFFEFREMWAPRNLVPKRFVHCMKIIIWHYIQGPNFSGPKSLGAQMRSGTISALALKALNGLQYHSFITISLSLNLL